MLREYLQTGHLPIGVDIGGGGARLLQLRKVKGAYTVVAAARVDLGVKADQMDDEERRRSLFEGLKRKIHGAGFVGRQCFVAADDSLLRVRSVRQPQMPREETDRAIRLEGSERLGFDAGETAQIGWVRAGEIHQGDDIRDELIVVGAKAPELERLVDDVCELGLRPLAVEPGFLACGRTFSRAYRRASDSSVVRMVVDVGARTTGVVILRGCDVIFFKSLPMGGARLTEAAADQLDMKPETIAELRRQRMLNVEEEGAKKHDSRADRAIYDAVRPLLEEMAGEVALCLRYYMVTFRGSPPEHALIVGGHAREPGLKEAIGEALHADTEIGRPLEGIDTSGASMAMDRRGDLAEWSVAAGLSLRGDSSQTADIAPEASSAATQMRRDGQKARTPRRDAA